MSYTLHSPSHTHTTNRLSTLSPLPFPTPDIWSGRYSFSLLPAWHLYLCRFQYRFLQQEHYQNIWKFYFLLHQFLHDLWLLLSFPSLHPLQKMLYLPAENLRWLLPLSLHLSLSLRPLLLSQEIS